MKHWITLLMMVFTLTAFAQKGTISGTVIEDASGQPVIAATIEVVDHPYGSYSDLDGAFRMDVPVGTYTIRISFITYETITIEGVVVKANDVTTLDNIRMITASEQIGGVVVKAEAIRNTDEALQTIKRKSVNMFDGISAAKMQQVGDGTAVEAAKRVTGVSIEGGKYVYIRGLGDRYSKTTLNGMDIPGLDPDKNSLQMDIFPTNLIDNIIVSKNFTADLPADFTGGILNIETKSFPSKKMFNVSLGIGFNPQMHFNQNYLDYEGGSTDFLGFDDGTRALPDRASQPNVPTPISGASDAETNAFIRSFSPTLGANRTTSLMDYSLGVSFGNQITLGDSNSTGYRPKLGYIFSLSYKTEFNYYNDVMYGEYQRYTSPELYELRYATVQDGELGERNVLLGGIGGVAYKTQFSKYRFMVMHLQSGNSTAGKFRIDNDGEAVGQSGYIAYSDNLEYSQRSLTNILFSGEHAPDSSKWEFDWRVSPTLSISNDPDIRKTAFTYSPVDTLFIAGAGGNPTRIWRYLTEFSANAKFDATRKYEFRGQDAKLKMGVGHSFKIRSYEILFFDIQFFGNQDWNSVDPSEVLNPDNLYPNRPNAIYYQSGNNNPNPNQYQSNINNTSVYVSNEMSLGPLFKTVIGLRAEKFVQRHTGRDQAWASGDTINGNNLDNDIVLDNLNLFPSLVFIKNNVAEDQNFRFSYTRTVARPSFKELSYAQIIDPITNRIFNGSLFSYSTWDGNLVQTDIDNIDFRWERFLNRSDIISASLFYKRFVNPIELVRIPEQQTSTEYQPRNVGNGQLFGVEFEFRKGLDSIARIFKYIDISGNLTLVESQIEMTDVEFRARKNFERAGENIDNIRQMAGQAPYVINAGISYNNKEIGLDAGFYYNVKGPTLLIVGAGLFPDIYFEPFHSLNFSANYKLNMDPETKISNTTLDFKVSNILMDRSESFYRSYKAEKQVFNSINPGISFSVGISHKFN